jgi:hypothetical protein
MSKIQLMVRVLSDTNTVVPGSTRVKSIDFSNEIPPQFVEGMTNLTFESASQAMDTIDNTYRHTRFNLKD